MKPKNFVNTNSVYLCSNCLLTWVRTEGQLCVNCAFLVDSQLIRKRQLEEAYRQRRRVNWWPIVPIVITMAFWTGVYFFLKWWLQ